MDEGLKHLIRVIGLCQTPRDSWSEEDNRALREARDYIQERRKEYSESKSEEASSEDASRGSEEQSASPSEDGVREERLPIEERSERTDGSDI